MPQAVEYLARTKAAVATTLADDPFYSSEPKLSSFIVEAKIEKQTKIEGWRKWLARWILAFWITIVVLFFIAYVSFLCLVLFNPYPNLYSDQLDINAHVESTIQRVQREENQSPYSVLLNTPVLYQTLAAPPEQRIEILFDMSSQWKQKWSVKDKIRFFEAVCFEQLASNQDPDWAKWLNTVTEVFLGTEGLTNVPTVTHTLGMVANKKKFKFISQMNVCENWTPHSWQQHCEIMPGLACIAKTLHHVQQMYARLRTHNVQNAVRFGGALTNRTHWNCQRLFAIEMLLVLCFLRFQYPVWFLFTENLQSPWVLFQWKQLILDKLEKENQMREQTFTVEDANEGPLEKEDESSSIAQKQDIRKYILLKLCRQFKSKKQREQDYFVEICAPFMSQVCADLVFDYFV